jgi:hypothetical protein
MKEDGMDGECSTHEEIRNAYKILLANPETERLLRGKDLDSKLILIL